MTRFPPAHCGDIHAAIEEERRFVEEMKAKARPSRLQEILKARKANGSDETLHSDEYCDPAIAAGLRLHRVDVTTNPDAGLLSAEDEEHIAYARDAGRVLFTRDEDFLRLNIAGMDRSAPMCPPVRRQSRK